MPEWTEAQCATFKVSQTMIETLFQLLNVLNAAPLLHVSFYFVQFESKQYEPPVLSSCVLTRTTAHDHLKTGLSQD